MNAQAPITIRFSNLLQTNPESCLYGLDVSLSASCNLQNGNILFQRIRRKSVNIQSLRNKKSIDRCQMSGPEETCVDKKIESIVTKDKINRLLLEANFEKELQANKNKRKKMYVIRKREEKSKPEKAEEQDKASETVPRSKTEAIQYMDRTENQQMFKIKRKVPKFGLEEIAPRCGSRKNSLFSNRCNIFLQTSSNTFYNNSFASNSRPKQREHSPSAEQPQPSRHEPAVSYSLMPEIRNANMIASMKNANFLHERRKQRELRERKFYDTNNNGFVFTRSKTEDIEVNVCGWQQNDQPEEEEDLVNIAVGFG